MSFQRAVLLTFLVGTSSLSALHAAEGGLSVDEFAVNASASQPNNIKDPFEKLNRKVFRINNYVDQHALLPVARVYQAVMPAPLNKGISNFFTNLAEPWTAVNQLLQGKPRQAAISLSRFTVNTLTTLGLADPAFASLKLQKGREDFGQTLAVWGLGSGPFLMLPVRGPSTLRDTGALAIDMFGTPQRYLDSDKAYYSLLATQLVDTRADYIGVESLVNGDQYSILRDVYLQRRQFQIDDGKVTQTTPALDEQFGDDLAEDATAQAAATDMAATPMNPPVSEQPDALKPNQP